MHFERVTQIQRTLTKNFERKGSKLRWLISKQQVRVYWQPFYS